ncbi:MAG: GNAT family N-acetyltransferase [Rhodobacteraceae bacterium]|nr:GNAT family N-acetyltransferase [Paracoccaceae bacterium]
MEGRGVRLERLTPAHAAGLYTALEGADANWNFLPYGPFDADGLADWVGWAAAQTDPWFFAILVGGLPLGVASYLRVVPEHGVAEVGHINFAPALKGTRAATEAMALMAERVFDAGYRRYEWKCDAANRPSRRAAERLGFSYEGVFRQHLVVKGHNRDTAWFAMTDGDWPAIRIALKTWLDRENFDADGRQSLSLSTLTRPHLVLRDPDLG